MQSFTAAELAAHVGGTLHGPADLVISGLETVRDAVAGQATFAGDQKHASDWSASAATACVVTDGLEIEHDDARAVIVVADADHAMIAMLELFTPPAVLPDPGMHPTAFVDPRATVGEGARIGAHVFVDRDATIGANVALCAGVRVAPGASIGDDSILHPNVVIRERCTIGARCILNAGVVIGTDGFGYRPAPGGGGLVRFPHAGTVEIGDDVELGAATCVDRGKFGATRIGSGTKIDNLCQIGHNCRIGRCVVISGLTGVAGSVVIEDGAQIGGGTGIADHITIGAGAQVGARSGVMTDVPPGEIWLGFPAGERGRVLREHAAIRKLPDWTRRLKRLLAEHAS